MSELNGKWVEAFSVPKGGTTGGWTEEDVERLVSLYNPDTHEAPIVVGHPQQDAPAYGWVKALRLRRNGKTFVDAQLHQVDPQFTELVKTGAFKQRSIGLYRNLEGTGGPYLRHLGFLGAAAPEVKGLKPIQFGDAEHIEFAVTIEGDVMSNEPNKDPKQKPALSEEHVGLLTRFAEGFKGLLAKWNDSPTASPDIKAALAQQRKDLETTFSEQFKALKKELTDAAAATAKTMLEFSQGQAKGTIQAFVDKLAAQGKWLPAFEKAYGLQTLMERLANSDVVLTFTEKVTVGDKVEEKEIKRPALEVLQRFFADLPELVNFDHITKKARTAAARGGRVAFTEPLTTKGMEVVGMELDQKVREIITASKKSNPDRPLTYSEAYRLAREAQQEEAAGQEA